MERPIICRYIAIGRETALDVIIETSSKAIALNGWLLITYPYQTFLPLPVRPVIYLICNTG